MKSRWLMTVVAVLAAATAGTGPALAADQGAPASTLCHAQTAPAGGGAYTLQNNEWGSGAPECVSAGGGAGFTVAKSSIHTATNGAPGGYPSLYKGCHWGACTNDSGLPLPVSSLTTGAVTTSWSTTQPRTGAYDVAYDIWFSQTPATTGAPNGAELMIWLNHHGPVQPFGSRAGPARAGGRSYQVWFGRQGWNTISYTMTTGATSVRDLDIGQLVADAVSRGYISRSWYLIDVEAGFELWQGGAGLATNSLAVNVHGHGGGSTAPSPPARGPARACSASYQIVNRWPGGFQGQVTLTNTSGSPLNGWKLGWTFPGDQKITDLWNGTVIQSGAKVSVTSQSYNGSLAPGRSVTVGFTGTYAGRDARPAAFTLNGAACPA